jgi:hypothetical protein
MLRLPAAAVVALAAIPLSRASRAPHPPPAQVDTIQAGDPRVDATRLRPFTLERRLTLTRGDTVQPFGRQ